MRQLRYSVAASLDGFIAGPNGEFDWIAVDPDIDFGAMYNSFSGLVMGRRSYEVSRAVDDSFAAQMPTYVFSRTLPAGERDGAVFLQDLSALAALKEVEEQKPLWLWGGGELFRGAAALGLVDGVDVAVIPVLLGAGVPLMGAPGPRLSLGLRRHRLYPKTGIVMLEYDVVGESRP